MSKLKVGKEFDEAALDVEWDEREDFTEYDGEQPPRGTILKGKIKRAWYTISSNGNPMLKVIFEAEGNKGELKQYNGLGVWDNITFTPKAAFRYGPFLQLFGFTLKDVKSKIDAEEEDGQGFPVNSIGKWHVGTDDSLCSVVTKRERYDGEIVTRVSKYMPADADSGKAAKNGEAGGKKKKGKKNKGADEDTPF